MATSASLNDYKLSCELLGHSMDVRGVTEGGPETDTVISGSRDRNVKIWKREGKEYHVDSTLSNHSNFVSSVYYLESEKWICTGSNDSSICVYKEGTTAPFIVLKGHVNTVCSISKGLERKTLISGSWDKTAKVWLIDEDGTSTCVTLEGHEAAVWAVTSLPTGKYVTGSADKNIFYWNSKGDKLRVLKGHTDCVRGLIGMEDGSLISCGNDAVIRCWNDDGDCVKELSGHANYIYTIALNKSLGNDILVSGGEDSSIRMWSLSLGELGDPIVLPAQSVWSVACLRNGDIVTGTSDGVVRVFTKDKSRIASKEALNEYQLAVQTRLLESNQELGNIKRNDLPGPESLLQPGRDGQTKIVRNSDGKITCYQWENNNWTLVGDVLGASGESKKSTDKPSFEGKEYDFVFSVDISDTEPPLKLPYNRGEDPWQSAQKFIHKNNLPQAYLDQVANFIVKNSDTPVIGHTPTDFQDPFTGESRYVPGTSNHFSSTGNVDPFTGDSSYTTNSNPKVPVKFIKGQTKHFPLSNFLTFDNCDPNKVLDKLREFNSKIEDNTACVSDDLLKDVIRLANTKPEIDKITVEALHHLLKWPKEILFPVLDITRLAIRNEQIFVILNSLSNFLDNILSNLQTSTANQLMSMRCLANMMRHESGRRQIYSRLEKIVDIIMNVKQGSANLQIAIATFYLNSTTSQILIGADAEKCRILTEGILELLKWSTDLEACHRAIQAIGSLTCTPFGSVTSAQVISVDYVMDKIREIANTTQITGYEKLNESANALLAAF